MGELVLIMHEALGSMPSTLKNKATCTWYMVGPYCSNCIINMLMERCSCVHTTHNEQMSRSYTAKEKMPIKNRFDLDL
jgi:hypothetical protein